LILTPVALPSVQLLVVAAFVKSLDGPQIGTEEHTQLPRLKAFADELPGMLAQASELSAATAAASKIRSLSSHDRSPC
jgi:hypothetical protein